MYRKFWLTNSKNETWYLTNLDVQSFLNEPQNLGFSNSVESVRYGNKASVTAVNYNFPSPTGTVVFYADRNADRYQMYNEFVRFLVSTPLTLHYMIPTDIPKTYSLDCIVTSLDKTESSIDNLMQCSIAFQGISFWKGEEIEVSGTGTSYQLVNNGDISTGFEISIKGTFYSPYFTVSQNDELYGEAKFNSVAPLSYDNRFTSIYVNSDDANQKVFLERNGSILPNPLSYQDLSISNGAIYVTFVKLAKGESTLTIGMDGGSVTDVDIKYTELYRSV